MKIELLVRFMKPRHLSKEEQEEQEFKKEEERIKRLTDKYYTEEPQPNSLDKIIQQIPVEFIYKPYVLDIRDIDGFYPLDDHHTVLITDLHGELAVKMTWDVWKGFYEYASSENIKTLKEYLPEELPKETRRKRGQK